MENSGLLINRKLLFYILLATCNLLLASLHKCSNSLCVVLKAEFFRSAIFFLFKNAVEVGHVIKSAAIGDLVYALRGIY
jgi:hypothetical protein